MTAPIVTREMLKPEHWLLVDDQLAIFDEQFPAGMELTQESIDVCYREGFNFESLDALLPGDLHHDTPYNRYVDKRNERPFAPWADYVVWRDAVLLAALIEHLKEAQ
jgi:hypothetical protein